MLRGPYRRGIEPEPVRIAGLKKRQNALERLSGIMWTSSSWVQSIFLFLLACGLS